MMRSSSTCSSTPLRPSTGGDNWAAAVAFRPFARGPVGSRKSEQLGGAFMRRREFLKRCSVFTTGLVLGAPSLSRAHQPAHPLEVGAGPQLFLDDYLIDQLDGF